MSGIEVRPWFIGTARGIAEGAALFVLFALSAAVSGPDVPDAVASWAPIIFAVVRSAEGFVDDRIDPTVRRGPFRGDTPT